MGKHASLRVSCPGAGVLALCANERFGFLTIGLARETKCHTFVCRNNHTVDNWKGFLLNRKAWVRFTACAHAGCGRIWFLRLTVDLQEKLHVMLGGGLNCHYLPFFEFSHGPKCFIL